MLFARSSDTKRRRFCDENESTFSIYSCGHSDSESVSYDFMSRRSESASTSSSYKYRHSRDKNYRPKPRHLRNRSRSRSRSRSLSQPRRHFGVLPIDYWERTEDCQEAKFLHMEKLDRLCESREMLVLNTTLYDCHTALEKNMFPCKFKFPRAICITDYSILVPDNTPKGVEHYTLWSRSDMSHREICEYVNRWLNKHMPHATR